LFKSLIAIFALERKLVWERVILIFLGGIINLWMIVSYILIINLIKIFLKLWLLFFLMINLWNT
jgi:hypothetical protein